jgi:Fic family protein
MMIQKNGRRLRMKPFDSDFECMGFHYPEWDIRTSSVPDVSRSCFRAKKILEGIVYDTVHLEGNPFTFPEVKTLLEGITVGGHKLSDERQVLNQAKSWKTLLQIIQSREFDVNKETFCRLQAIVAEEEAMEWGQFRTGPVSIAGTGHIPPASDDLDAVFNQGLAIMENIQCPHKKGILFFLFGSLHQFFWDGNKRSSRLIMNGILLSSGYDVINIPAKKQLEFNEKMIRFYDGRDGAEMIEFLISCSLDPDLKVYSGEIATDP